jgi:hypothetical protein
MTVSNSDNSENISGNIGIIYSNSGGALFCESEGGQMMAWCDDGVGIHGCRGMMSA